MSRYRGAAEATALVAAAVLLCAVVGYANPLPEPRIGTDRLGPDNGERVDEYLARATESVDDARTDNDLHWALVSFDSPLAPLQSYESAAEVRIAQVLLRVPIERVQTQELVVGVPGTEASILEATDTAASRLQGSMGEWDRRAQVDAVSAARLAAGCDCVVGLVVHADGTSLQALGARPDIRAVEALPADAIAGRFAVRAFLPDYVDVVGSLPDDGPIPPR
ncbi:MAG: hypothetical protein WBQ44_16010 [Rhodococcus sp. (in: high G+C Gram-positive bacteria)]